MTDNRKDSGVVRYDADCSLCVDCSNWVRPILEPRGFRFAPLPGIDRREMQFITPEGKTFGGANAILEICRRIWWASPIYALGKIPFIHRLLDFAYRHFAARRNCLNGACKIRPDREWLGWLPLMILPGAAIVARSLMEPWFFMWALSFAVFFGCKWQTWWPYRHHLTFARSVAYLFAWVGMNPRPFLKITPNPVRRSEWLAAIAKTLLGVALVWLAVPLASHPLLRGWIGMVGIVMMLHFGCFHFLALFWRYRGFAVEPLMDRPALATSLARFWNNHWNRGFHDLAHAWFFKPIARRAGLTTAICATFLASGLVHDLVISLPAHGGYGLPTLYFLIHALGIFIERSGFGKRHLGHGIAGWCFVAIFTIAPLGWLFHPPFITNIILPMLDAIGATAGKL